MTATRERLVAGLFILPAGLLIGGFIFVPAARMALSSLQVQPLTASGGGSWCGTDNYRLLFTDPDFRQALSNTATFALLAVPAQTVLALLLALWTNGPGWRRRWLRIAVFVPTTLSLAVLSVLWRLLLEPQGATGGGLINGMLAATGLPGQPFLSSPAQALYCIVAMSVWQGVGFQMMIFLAGLQAVPGELYEAARIDGAGAAARLRRVTLPMLRPTTVLVVMITTIFALKLFVQPYLMTGGGPQGATQSLVQYMVETAFRGRDLGLAGAVGVLLFAGVLAVSVVHWRLARGGETP